MAEPALAKLLIRRIRYERGRLEIFHRNYVHLKKKSTRLMANLKRSTSVISKLSRKTDAVVCNSQLLFRRS